MDFEPPKDAMKELARLLSARPVRFEIRGDHGAGKSTLLAEAGAQLGAMGFCVTHVAVRPDEPSPKFPLPCPGERDALLVDGLNHLPVLRRWWWLARMRKAGAVVLTTHWMKIFPHHIALPPDADFAWRLVKILDPQFPEHRRPWVERVFADSGGDLRRLFLECYDAWPRVTSFDG